MAVQARFDSHLWTVLESAGRALAEKARQYVQDYEVVPLLQVFVREGKNYIPCYFDFNSDLDTKRGFDALIEAAIESSLLKKNELAEILESLEGGAHWWGLRKGIDIDKDNLSTHPVELSLAILCRTDQIAPKDVDSLSPLATVAESALRGRSPLGAILELFYLLSVIHPAGKDENHTFLHNSSDLRLLRGLAAIDKGKKREAARRLCEALPSTLKNSSIGSARWTIKSHSGDHIAVAATFWVPTNRKRDPIVQIGKAIEYLKQETQLRIPPLFSAFNVLYELQTYSTEKEAGAKRSSFQGPMWSGLNAVVEQLRTYWDLSEILRRIIASLIRPEKNSKGKNLSIGEDNASQICICLLILDHLELILNGKVLAVPGKGAMGKGGHSLSHPVYRLQLDSRQAQRLLGPQLGRYKKVMARPTSNWSKDYGAGFNKIKGKIGGPITFSEIMLEVPWAARECPFYLMSNGANLSEQRIKAALQAAMEHGRSLDPYVIIPNRIQNDVRK